tara:strand:+ start:4769 stop:5848 length:1080 start_codon:yes stop_codon:yes gene_type:complete
VSYHPDAAESWASIADITPHEDERINALQYRADALLRWCDGIDARPRDHADCARALLDAKRASEAIVFISDKAANFHDRAAAHDWLASALYESGAYREALRQKRAALAAGQPPSPARPSGFNPDAAVRALRGIIQILAAAGIMAFPAAGTLLGICRDGAPLGHDRDVDIGVLGDLQGGPDLARIIRQHPDLLLNPRSRPGDRYFALTFKTIAVDIFLYEPGDGGLHCGLGRRAGDVAWRFTAFGLKDVSYHGQVWTVPDNPERYLAETYGPDWRTPDTGFASVLSSPALFAVNPYVRAYYALSRAHGCLLSGDTAKARALLRQSPVPVDLPGLADRTSPTSCATQVQPGLSTDHQGEGR